MTALTMNSTTKPPGLVVGGLSYVSFNQTLKKFAIKKQALAANRTRDLIEVSYYSPNDEFYH
jgi:hypothetical protein